MKNITIIAALTAILITGCAQKEDSADTGTDSPATSSSAAGGATQPAVYAYEEGSKEIGDKGICVVCTVTEGSASAEEEVKDTLDYKGKTYVFCNESEKADFISDPEMYVGQ